MLDVMSGGRMEYAFPLGTGMEYWSNAGAINPTTARARFRESLEVILKAWTEDGPDPLRRRLLHLPLPQRVAEAVPEAAPEVLHRRAPAARRRCSSPSTTTWATRSSSCRSRTSSRRSRGCASSPTSGARRSQPDDLIIVVIAYVADTDEEAVREARPHIEKFFCWFHRVPPKYLLPPGLRLDGGVPAPRVRSPALAKSTEASGTTWSAIGRIACGSPDTVADTIVALGRGGRLEPRQRRARARRHARVEDRQEHDAVRQRGDPAHPRARSAGRRAGRARDDGGG